MRSMMAVLVVAVFAGCSDERNVKFTMGDQDSTFAGREVELAPSDQFAVVSRDGVVKLGLTRERVYFTASDAVREHVDSTLQKEMSESDSRFARAISGAVRRGLQSALAFDVDFRIDEIRDVDYVDGELVFDWVDPEREGTLDNVEIDDQPVTRAFDAESGRAFVRAFRRVKRGETLRDTGLTVDSASTDGASTSTPAAADTAGGASF